MNAKFIVCKIFKKSRVMRLYPASRWIFGESLCACFLSHVKVATAHSPPSSHMQNDATATKNSAAQMNPNPIQHHCTTIESLSGLTMPSATKNPTK